MAYKERDSRVRSYFTIEWYFDESYQSGAQNYFNKLNIKQQQKTMALFKRMAHIGKIFDKTKFRNEGDKIYAFKPAPDRFLCFFTRGNKVIITNAYSKKTEKLPAVEKQRALDRMNDYDKRTKKGTYYL